MWFCRAVHRVVADEPISRLPYRIVLLRLGTSDVVDADLRALEQRFSTGGEFPPRGEFCISQGGGEFVTTKIFKKYAQYETKTFSRVDEMSRDIHDQLIDRIKVSGSLSGIRKCGNISQFMVYVRYIYDGKILDDFLFCRGLTSKTTAHAVLKVVSDFFYN